MRPYSTRNIYDVPFKNAVWSVDARPENLQNSDEDFVEDIKMRGVVSAQIDVRIGLLSSSPTVVFAKAL